MTNSEEKPKRINLVCSLSFYPDELKLIDEIAERENRKRSNVIYDRCTKQLKAEGYLA